MTAERRPKAPTGLDRRGRQFWTKTVKTFTLSDAELELLVEVCRALDQCEALQSAITVDGITVTGSKGQSRVHPAVAELRQVRLAVGRLIAQLALPDDEGDSVPSPTTLRARNAAGARWGHRADIATERRRKRGSA